MCCKASRFVHKAVHLLGGTYELIYAMQVLLPPEGLDAAPQANGQPAQQPASAPAAASAATPAAAPGTGPSQSKVRHRTPIPAPWSVQDTLSAIPHLIDLQISQRSDW